MSELKIALSPCPNDVFIMAGLLLKKITAPFNPVFLFEDIDALNTLAIQGEIPVIKASFGVWEKIKKEYQLLSVGSAMGFGTGPLLVGKNFYKLEEFPMLKVAIPGEYTTAHLLFKFFYPGKIQKIFLRYDKIIPAILQNQVDMGILIHEGRFVFHKYGLVLIQDLGNYWETKTKAPVPLGGFFVKRELSKEVKKSILKAIKNSLEWAKTHEKEVMPLLKKYAQEIEEEVIRKHVKTYVNEYTENLGQGGLTALKTLGKVLKTPFEEGDLAKED